jgi:CheY-like chemotaxis protein
MTTHILMVDDEPDAQELFSQNFRREIRQGIYAFDFALSGEAALEVLKGRTPPKVVMVLSDINMPGMSGIELLAEIREHWPEVGVFMITAYGDQATETKARELGAVRFLSKPVDFEALKDDLSRVLASGEESR